MPSYSLPEMRDLYVWKTELFLVSSGQKGGNALLLGHVDRHNWQMQRTVLGSKKVEIDSEL